MLGIVVIVMMMTVIVIRLYTNIITNVNYRYCFFFKLDDLEESRRCVLLSQRGLNFQRRDLVHIPRFLVFHNPIEHEKRIAEAIFNWPEFPSQRLI